MIDKKGWEKKKLGEVCSFYNGKAHEQVIDEDGRYILINSKFIASDGKSFKRTNQQLFPLTKGDITMVMSDVPNGRAMSKCFLVDADNLYSLNQRICVIRSDFFDNSYLYRQLNRNNYFLDFNDGDSQTNLRKDDILNCPLIIPPLPIQHQIVSELDTLSDIISKKKQQLADLDTLAQATFYDMFGDPVSNEKGWKRESIGNVAPVKAFKGKVKSVDGKYWLLNLDMVESNSGDILGVNMVADNEIGNSTVAFNEENVLYSKLRPYLNKVVNPNKSGYSTSELLPLLPQKGLLDKTFLVLLLRSKFFVNYIQEKVAGAKMPRVSMDVFRAFQIILPPLSLQMKFSERIEGIEVQKELINKSLDEVQHLFDYTMDRYFN